MSEREIHSLGENSLAKFFTTESDLFKNFNSRPQKSLAIGASQKPDVSDVGEYFKDGITLSEDGCKNQGRDEEDETAPKVVSSSRRGQTSKAEDNESNIDKYFKDSLGIEVGSTLIKSNTTKAIKKLKSTRSRTILNVRKIEQQNINQNPLRDEAFNEEIQKTVYLRNDPKCNLNGIDENLLNGTEKSISQTAINDPSTVVDRERKTVNLSCISKIVDIVNGKTNQTSLNKSDGSKSFANNENSRIGLSLASVQDCCKLEAWGLPRVILQRYESRGITTMFPWQVECLSNRRVMEECRNLVYSAPTSAGKTLVAEILLVKTVLERRKKVIFILPFISVVREKMFYFQDLLSNSGVRVEGFMGGLAPAGGFAATHVAIATIEKANSLVNRLMEDGSLTSLGAVVIDELHLIGDPHRGYLLELLLTKLKYMTLREEHVNVQLIGMSATLPNLSLLARWLDAELYKTAFRPVPLNEQCKIGTTVYDNKLYPIRKLVPLSELPSDADNILQLCIETIADGHSVLIFCPTKNWCEKLAHQVAATFFKLGNDETSLGRILREQLDSTAICETLEQLKRSPTGLDSVLKNAVSFGVAFHHAGLTMDERDIIEGAFRTGSVRVLTATSTLSSGVNLPARRVIIRSLMFHGKPLDTLTYKQMIGRAGRMGKDTAGESILICKPNEKLAAKTLLAASLEPISSCLEDSAPLIRALLEVIASEVAYTPADVDLYTRCTLVSLDEGDDVRNPTKDAMKYLVDNEFLLLQENDQGEQRWVATPLGKACLASSVPPREGLFLFEELQRARRCFVLDTELHVVYIVTPCNSGSQIGQIDWMVYLELWKKLSESDRRVGQVVGIEERFIMSALRGTVKSGRMLHIHRRFYTALALHDLVREVSLPEVSEKYACNRGLLQSLQQSAATFAGMVTQFCKQLGWDCMELLVAQFQARLQFGVCRELLDLLRLPMLNGIRARSLYKEGITSVPDLAAANELDVERALYKALPFESEKELDGEQKAEADHRNKMRTIFVTGRDGLTPRQAAIMLVREARALVQNELGIEEVQWRQSKESQHSNAHSQVSRNSPASARILTKAIINTNCNDTAPSFDKKIDVQVVDEESLDNNEVLRDFTNVLNEPRAGSIDKRRSKVQSVTLIDNGVKENEKLPHRNRDSLISVEDKDDGERRTPRNSISPDPVKMIKTGGFTDTERDSSLSMATDRAEEIAFCRTSEISNSTSPELLCDDIDEDRRHSKSLISFKKYHGTSRKLVKSSEEKENIVDVDIALEAMQNKGLGSAMRSSSEATTNNRDRVPVKSHSSERKTEVCSILSKEKAKISTLGECMQEFSSRSPSLFEEDSLYLDTQICDALEENVFEESDTSSSKINTEYTERRSSEVVRNVSSPNIAHQTVEATNENSKNEVSKRKGVELTWNDDSWNNTKVLLEKMNKLDVKKTSETKVTVVRSSNIKQGIRERQNSHSESIRDVEKIEEIPPTPVSKTGSPRATAMTRNLGTLSTRGIKPLKNITYNSSPMKRKYSGTHVESDNKSPIASILTFAGHRKLSIDSNKSDSDDIVIASQSPELRISTDKGRGKLKLEKPRKLATQKLTNKADKLLNSNKTSLNIQKLSHAATKAHTRKVFNSKNYSIDSIVSNSDEDRPSKKLKTMESSKGSILLVGNEMTEGTSSLHLNSKKEHDEVDPPDWTTLDIINVTRDKTTFSNLRNELRKRTNVALALACEKFVHNTITSDKKIIGIPGSERKKRSRTTENCVYGETKVCGIALSWGKNVVYYVSLDNDAEIQIPFKERITLLADVLSSTTLSVRCFATKTIYKILHQCCGITAACRFLDPKTADWLLNSDSSEKNFGTMTNEYFRNGLVIMQHACTCYGHISPGLDIKSSSPASGRAAVEAVITWHTMEAVEKKLSEMSPRLLYTFKEIEMRAVSILARMELTGMGINVQSLEELSSVIEREMRNLEQRAYFLAGRKFNFCSSKEVAQILGMYNGKKVSTRKAVLEHSDNPISNLTLSWRKLSGTRTKMVLPLLRSAQNNSRVHGNCIMRTVTGRISMHEPNLQNVPRDFHSEDKTFVISVRMAFVPALGNILVSADYCQLELRLLAHFSRDPVLCDIMRRDGDLFRNIAAKWNNVSEGEVDDAMRQRTKQLCYGMIYGMGVKSLADQLSVAESKATEFLEKFMGTYPGIRKWLSDAIEQSRLDGYVTTLMGRRRLLPGLSSQHPAEKAQAERQAVNTKVQGSAADLAKKAMVTIEDRMREEFPGGSLIFYENTKRKLRSNSRDPQPRGGYLVLQLHDELLYEVNIGDLHKVVEVIKSSMERVYSLAVPLPVKIKVGPAWGDLVDYSCGK